MEIHQVPGRSANLLLWHIPSEDDTLAASAGLVCWTGLATLLSSWYRKGSCLYLALGREPDERAEDACSNLLSVNPLAGPAMVKLL